MFMSYTPLSACHESLTQEQAACVYPTTRITGPSYQQACEDALTAAQVAINDNDIWQTYLQKVAAIYQDVISLSSQLGVYITGYAKFFNPTPRTADVCDSTYFLDVTVIGRNLMMRAANRQAMNDLVDLVNSRIQTQVVAQLPFPFVVQFVNIDDMFDGHRFCEPAFDDDPIGRGSHSQDVWFNDLETDLDETGEWNPEPDNVEVAVWTEWASGIPDSFDDPNFGRGIRDPFQQASVFHPKQAAYALGASRIANIVINA